MESATLQRRLAAILSADVVGYSRLMGDDEVATVHSIRACRETMTASVQEYRGRVVDSPGDNLLAEFGSAVDALGCAVAVQERLASLNAGLPEHRRMRFRMGLNVGDVLVQGKEIYGDGVNIAARMEGLADPGGICISGAFYDQVKSKIRIRYEPMGPQQVKNIEEPVPAYKVLWGDGSVQGRSRRARPDPRRGDVSSTRLKPFRSLIITCILLVILMPIGNHFQLNLLTKLWQCRLILLPNAGQVTVVTIGEEEHEKMIIPEGMPEPQPFMSHPRLWRMYHATVIERLHELGAAAVGFDFWFSPSDEEETQEPTARMAEALREARNNRFPIVLAQFQNLQDPSLYQEASWGFITLYKDITWIQRVMYLMSWDWMAVEGEVVGRPSFFLQVLAEKLGMIPALDHGRVKLMGPSIPLRLWLAFARTPFDQVPYARVFNGEAEKEFFSGKIVLIGLGRTDTDYFHVPYSPTDFTPENPGDPAGMPGVFLFAHAINQVIEGYYQPEINDEWTPAGWNGENAVFRLESLLFLLLEIIGTGLLLYAACALIGKERGIGMALSTMGATLVGLLAVLAYLPTLFGLFNVFLAGLLFMGLCFWNWKKSAG